VTEYDLADTRKLRDSRNLRLMWLTSGTLLALVGAGLIYVIVDFSLKGAWTTGNIVFAGAVGFVAAATAGVFLTVGPLPEKLEVDEDGIHLRFRRGRIRTKRWKDPSFNLRVSSRAGASEGQGPDQSMYVVFTGRPPKIYVTEPAFEAILLQAKSSGLSVRQVEVSSRGFTRILITAP
jgi:hypothetical protein